MTSSTPLDPVELHRLGGALYDELVELAPPDRDVVLAAASPEVAAYARRMLAADGDALGDALAELTPRPALERDPAGVLGADVGEYHVERLLGRGGMGAVYLGRRANPEALVAIKFVTVATPSREVHERFERETAWIARVDHPNVVRYRGSSVDGRGRPYLVMDFVDGRPLSHAAPEVADDVRRTVELVARVAEAAHHLHQRGILHRDLKPSNVLLTERDGAVVPVLVDLGIARALEGSGDDTIAPGPVGTPDFMSPEQFTVPCPPDVRTDVYGLGAILFSLLCGTSARRASSLRRASSGRAVGESRRDEPAPVPSASVDPDAFANAAARRRAIDADLDAVVRRALEPRIEDRYESARALADDLERWLGGFPVEARRVRPVQRLAKLVRRRPAESALAAALVATLAVGGALLVRSVGKERAAATALTGQVAIAEGALEFLGNEVLYQASAARMGPDAPILDVLREATRALLERREDLVPEVAVDTARVFLALYAELDLTEEAVALVDGVAPLADALEEHSPQRLQFQHKRGLVALRDGRQEEGERILRELTATLRPWRPEDPRLARVRAGLLAQAAFDLGVADLMAGRTARARELLEPALAELEGLADVEQLEIRLRFALARVDLVEGAYPEARATYLRLRELLVELQGEDGPDPASIDTNLSDVAREMGDPAEALRFAERALATFAKHFPPEHAQVLAAEQRRVAALEDLGRLREAAEGRVGLVAARYAAGNGDPLDVEAALDDLGQLELAGADLALTRRALEQLVRWFGDDAAESARGRVHYARSLAAIGEASAAAVEARRALEVLGDASVPERECAIRLVD